MIQFLVCLREPVGCLLALLGVLFASEEKERRWEGRKVEDRWQKTGEAGEADAEAETEAGDKGAQGRVSTFAARLSWGRREGGLHCSYLILICVSAVSGNSTRVSTPFEPFTR